MSETDLYLIAVKLVNERKKMGDTNHCSIPLETNTLASAIFRIAKSDMTVLLRHGKQGVRKRAAAHFHPCRSFARASPNIDRRMRRTDSSRYDNEFQILQSVGLP